MVHKIFELLKEKNLSIALAESCTGGLLSSRLTDVSGSSNYVKGGIIAYVNEIKHSVLGVDKNILRKFGAVSLPTAQEMSENIRKIFSASIGISTTGIAGSKKIEDKLVGTIFIGISSEKFRQVKEFHLNGDRIEVKSRAVDSALIFLLETLLGNHFKEIN